jgi:hypothetical protein
VLTHPPAGSSLAFLFLPPGLGSDLAFFALVVEFGLGFLSLLVGSEVSAAFSCARPIAARRPGSGSAGIVS